MLYVCVGKCCGSVELASYIYGQLWAAGQVGCFWYACLCDSAHLIVFLLLF